MPSTIDDQFQKFIVQIGLRKEIAAELWDANIHSPQELAGSEVDDLQKITDNKLLICKIHPLLQQYLFNITMAKDPYKKAIGILKKHAAEDMDSDEEVMDTTPSLAADSTVSDSTAFVNNSTATSNTAVNVGRTSGRSNGTNNARGQQGGIRFTNETTHLHVTGNRAYQSQFGSTNEKKGAPKGNTITITGGNFVQANVMGQGPVTYNNTNTTITTSLDQNFAEDVKKRRAHHLHSTMLIDGVRRNTADLVWRDNRDYWINDFKIPTSDYDRYAQHVGSDSIYDMRDPKSCRALILNNVQFSPSARMEKRAGADMDCQRIEKLVNKLGFGDVVRENNKTAAEMKQLLKEFAKSRKNVKAHLTLVYIGSHGERDGDGNDTFVGSDGVRVKFSEIKEMFSATNCPELVGKPKVFLLQFCRQENKGRPTPPASAVFQTASVVGDSSAFTEEPKEMPTQDANETRDMDMLCVFATLAGTKAYRDTSDGSWFVTAIVRVIEETKNKDDFLSILTKVNNFVALNEGKEGSSRAIQVSEVVHNLRKKIYFFPGQE